MKGNVIYTVFRTFFVSWYVDVMHEYISKGTVLFDSK